jgi:hypothetical protein
MHTLTGNDAARLILSVRQHGRPPAEYEQAWRDGTLGQVPARGPGSRPRRQDDGGGHGRR